MKSNTWQSLETLKIRQPMLCWLLMSTLGYMDLKLSNALYQTNNFITAMVLSCDIRGNEHAAHF